MPLQNLLNDPLTGAGSEGKWTEPAVNPASATDVVYMQRRIAAVHVIESYFQFHVGDSNFDLDCVFNDIFRLPSVLEYLHSGNPNSSINELQYKINLAYIRTRILLIFRALIDNKLKEFPK